MPRRSRRHPLALQWMELAWAAPWVIARRVAHSDGAERTRMVTEKMAAGVESWNALAVYAFALQRSLMRELMRHRNWSSLATGAPFFGWAAFMRQAERGMASASAPFHRRVTSNARRLGSLASRRKRRAQ